MDHLGARIRELRERDGLSQQRLAETLGVNKSAISHWESGTWTPIPVRILSLAKLFGVSTDYLMDGADHV